MNIARKTIAVILLLVSVIWAAEPSVVVLNNGNKIAGVVTKTNDGNYLIDIKGLGHMVIQAKNVKSIDGVSPEKAKQINKPDGIVAAKKSDSAVAELKKAAVSAKKQAKRLKKKQDQIKARAKKNCSDDDDNKGYWSRRRERQGR